MLSTIPYTIPLSSSVAHAVVCSGEDREFEMAMEYFQSVYGFPLLDLSCASGIFTRK